MGALRAHAPGHNGVLLPAVGDGRFLIIARHLHCRPRRPAVHAVLQLGRTLLRPVDGVVLPGERHGRLRFGQGHARGRRDEARRRRRDDGHHLVGGGRPIGGERCADVARAVVERAAAWLVLRLGDGGAGNGLHGSPSVRAAGRALELQRRGGEGGVVDGEHHGVRGRARGNDATGCRRGVVRGSARRVGAEAGGVLGAHAIGVGVVRRGRGVDVRGCGSRDAGNLGSAAPVD